MSERKVSDVAVADPLRVSQDPGLAVSHQRRVCRIEGADARGYSVRPIFGGQQNPGGFRVLQLNEIRLVLHLEGSANPTGQWVISVAHINAELANRRMG